MHGCLNIILEFGPHACVLNNIPRTCIILIIFVCMKVATYTLTP